ncbi:hypothetical protein F2Q68_00043048 [Brassica cretica]|uniref:Uncharacterized protein n=1 Tax=Brassica cretica TaxID=69181 RepID=A0A8S9LH16_BRACR|nr:hypothetical protein F2Q68_00043048 [Brassica cretica]
MFNLVRSGGNGVFGSRSGGPVTIGVRVCRWGRLCGWSGFFFLAEAPSDDSTGFDLESDGAWSPEEATIPAVLHSLPSSLLLSYCWFSVVGTRGVVFSWCCRPSSELPVAARGEFLRLHPRLIGELRLPESSSGLWQRVGLSLSRNKGVIFGSVVSAKEVQSGGCGLGLHPRLIGELRLPESSSGLWQRVGLSLSRNKGVIFGSVVSAKEVQSGGCGLGVYTVPGLGRVGGSNLQVNFPNDGTAYHWTPPRAAGLSTVLQGLGRLSLRELAATEISVHSHLLFGPSTLR